MAVSEQQQEADPESSGVMLVRVWVHDGRLVARLQSARSGSAEHETAVAVGTDEIAKTLSRWLEDLLETPQ